jgi:Nucleotide-sugar transporter
LFKLCLSTIFFYQTCWRRYLKANEDSIKHSEAQPLTKQPKSPEESSKTLLSGDSESGDDTDTTRISLEDIEIKKPNWRPGPFSPFIYFHYCRKELNLPTIFAYGHLALFYATINNTVFVLFKLADPGTIQLIKSGITLITALALMLTVGQHIARLQWVAIGFQICGLIVTQYHPGTGTIYPLSTYLILFFQTFTTAVAGVYNQHLLKSQNTSLHAQNMALYAFGVVTNTIIHAIISMIKDDEPGMFEGFDNVGAILVIVSNILNGLAITAVYKCKSIL